jgi:hypothetical protein
VSSIVLGGVQLDIYAFEAESAYQAGILIWKTVEVGVDVKVIR